MRFLLAWLACLALLSAVGCGGVGPAVGRSRPAPPVAMAFPTEAPATAPSPRPAATAPAQRAPRRPAVPRPAHPPPASPPASVHRLDQDLQRLVENVVGDQSDHYGVMIQRLSDGRSAQLNPGMVFYAASLFKLPVMVEAYHQAAIGVLSMDELLEVTDSAAEYDLGTLSHDVGEAVPISQLLVEMIANSDNVAAILLLGRVGGAATDETLAALGLDHTSVDSADLPTTAGDMGRLMELLARGQVVDPASSEAMLALMRRQRINDRIPQGVPSGVPVAHKTGNWDHATHDIGVVFAPTGAYVLAILSDLPWDNEAIIRLSREVYRYFEGFPAVAGPPATPGPSAKP